MARGIWLSKTLPILTKYLLVVAASCVLSFVISTNAKTEPLGKTPVAETQRATQSGYTAAGPFAVSAEADTWRDASRNRDIPVRVIVPTLDKTTATLLPVILFSHGLGGTVMGGRTWGEHWASHGFLVVHMQHPGSDDGIWRGKGVRALESARQAMSVENALMRVMDVRFVIDQVVMRSKARTRPFALANINAIGMSGHSFGGQTTFAIAGQTNGFADQPQGRDERVKAAIALSPNARNKRNLGRQYGGIAIPVMSITGSADGSVLGDGTDPQDRLLPYQHLPTGGKYLLVSDRGDHMIFGGNAAIAGRSRGRDEARDVEIESAVKAATVAFWMSHLKGDAAARKWLEEGGFTATLLPLDRFEFK